MKKYEDAFKTVSGKVSCCIVQVSVKTQLPLLDITCSAQQSMPRQQCSMVKFVVHVASIFVAVAEATAAVSS